MRLLQRLDDNSFGLTEDIRDNVPNYAILSHTWLINDEEVTFEDFKNGDPQRKVASYDKLRFCGERAAKDDLRYFWVDTCCINRSSSQELQETITRMFEWYRNAARCYVYLTDVTVTEDQLNNSASLEQWRTAFCSSRWFTRGWTLQELLAPASVEFYSIQGTRLGDKISLQQWIHEITRIPLSALQGESFSNFSVAERLSWAEDRQTSREEDKAYCLFGLFTVFMPLMYGEGGDHAFNRLQDGIEKAYSENAKFDHLLDTLPTIPQAAFNSLENQHGSTCLANTRVELLREISEWVDGSDDKCIYWLNGIAGTGKSTVARTIARRYHDEGSLGGSFFFSKIGGVNHADRIFTTLASQLAKKIPAVRRHVCNAIMEHKDVALHSLRDQWDQLIIHPLAKLSSSVNSSAVILVIDALDECESDKDIRIILRLLATTKKLTNIHLRVFITSRPDISIRVGFLHIPEVERQVFFLHDIPATLVNRDLSTFFEQNFRDLKEERGFPDNWSGMQFISQLVEISCGLFIWASTACRYIREGRQLALKRIQILIQGHRSGAGPEKQLDKIYITVLKGSIPQDFDEEEKKELYSTIKSILGSIVILLSPLSTNALASLLDTDVTDVDETLADLHTIINIPNRKDRPIRLHHPTFRDFLLNKERCTDLSFWVDEKEAHEALADNCIDLMSKMLKRNICGLSSPGVRAKDVDPNLMESCIPPELQYACVYWAEHYRRSGTLLRDNDKTNRFFQEHYLHWLEAINLMGKSSEMSATIRMYESLLTISENPIQIPFVRDARKFIFAFQTIIEEAPLQVYCAALAFIPFTNDLKLHFRSQLHPWFMKVLTAEAIAPEAKEEWNYVNDIVFTPDGRHVASGSVNEVVRVWDVATKAPFRTFTGQSDKVCSLAISPDSTMIAAGSDDSTAMVWDMKTGTVRYNLTGHSRWVNALLFSPDGKLLVSGSMDETIIVYHAATGKLLKVVEAAKSCVNGLAFSPDGTMIASATVDELVRLWNITDNEVTTIFDGHSGPVNNVRFSPVGKRIAFASDDMTVKIWNVSTGMEFKTLRGHRRKVWAVTYSPDGLNIASGSEDKTIMLWNAYTGSHIITLSGHVSGINAVTYSPTGALLASGSFNDDVRFWDAKNGEPRGKLIDFEDSMAPGSLSNLQLNAPASNQDITPGSSNPDLPREVKYRGHSSTITYIVFSPDGQSVASGSQDATIKLWARDGTERHKLKGHTGGISQLMFSYDSRLLASASVDQTIKIWDTMTGASICTLKGHSGNIRSCEFSSDSSLFASCSTDKTVVLWDIITGAVLRTFVGHSDSINSILFSPHNDSIASCSADMTIRLWSINSTDMMLKLLGGHLDSVNSIAFSPDQRFLVSGSADKTIRFWDLAGDEACSVARGHTLSVNSVAVSRDSKRVVSSSDDTTVRVWDFETQSLLYTLHTEIVVRTVSFCTDNQQVKTDRGMLNLDISPVGFPPVHSRYALFVTDEWVKRDKENAVWIPENYYATSVATWDETAVLGQSSGSIIFVVFN